LGGNGRGWKGWETVGRHSQRWEEMGGGGEAQEAVGRVRRRWGGNGRGRKG